ncbi:hypothetical protein ADJ73_10970 [Arsenicicoccus sp. oral taxon 190]|nr:hypothetical protein ADJ73_10970 [Arsenicicoccus sp. oral taxon 190]
MRRPRAIPVDPVESEVPLDPAVVAGPTTVLPAALLGGGPTGAPASRTSGPVATTGVVETTGLAVTGMIGLVVRTGLAVTGMIGLVVRTGLAVTGMIGLVVTTRLVATGTTGLAGTRALDTGMTGRGGSAMTVGVTHRGAVRAPVGPASPIATRVAAATPWTRTPPAREVLGWSPARDASLSRPSTRT